MTFLLIVARHILVVSFVVHRHNPLGFMIVGTKNICRHNTHFIIDWHMASEVCLLKFVIFNRCWGTGPVLSPWLRYGCTAKGLSSWFAIRLGSKIHGD